MENRKFEGTPGPWQVVDTYDNYEPYTLDTPQMIIWDGDEQASKAICDMGEMGDMNYAEELANATLIAAAPELLNALQKAVNDYGREGGPWNVPSEPGTWIALAHAALDKALLF